MMENVNRNLFCLLAGQFISQLGDKFYEIALAVWILETTNSAIIMGLFVFFATLPQVILGLFAGAFIDRWSKKKILISTDVLRGILITLIVIMYYFNSLSITMIILIQILSSINAAFFTPTTQAIIPRIVNKNDLVSANSKSQLITGIVTIAGPILGALIISCFGYGLIFLFNAASFFISAVLEFFLQFNDDKGDKNQISIITDISEGYKYVLGRQKIVIVLIVVAIIHLFVGSIQVIIPILANKLDGIGAQNLGYLQASYGLGTVLVSFFVGKNKNKINENKLLFTGIFSMGMLYVSAGGINLMGFNNIIPFLVLFSILGGALVLAGISFQVILQKNIEPHMGGRVFSVVTSVRYLSIPISSLIFGILIGKFAISYIILAAGILVLPITLILVKTYFKKLSYNLDSSS